MSNDIGERRSKRFRTDNNGMQLPNWAQCAHARALRMAPPATLEVPNETLASTWGACMKSRANNFCLVVSLGVLVGAALAPGRTWAQAQQTANTQTQAVIPGKTGSQDQ